MGRNSTERPVISDANAWREKQPAQIEPYRDAFDEAMDVEDDPRISTI